MKKRILFVINSLEIGGAEKSLISLLSSIDRRKYDVDLQLFKYGGELEKYLPSYVNILPSLPYNEFCTMPLYKAIFKGKFLFLYSRLLFSFFIRILKPRFAASYAVYEWRIIEKCYDKTSKEYDVAIAYAQNISTFYVAECVNARKKIAWVNEIYRPKENHISFIEEMYEKYANVCCVSEQCLKEFVRVFPQLVNRTVLMMDINNASAILMLSKESTLAKDEMLCDGIKILTVGRLVKEKGYDIVVDACKELKKKRINFKWFIIGDGSCKKEIENLLQINNLNDNLILLGSRSNPYPYFLETNIYVQTSRLEGFGLTVAEAKIFNLPIVSTNFSAVYTQLSHRFNGIIAEMSGLSVASGIIELINNPKLKNDIINNLKKEKKGNIEEISVFYHLIEE